MADVNAVIEDYKRILNQLVENVKNYVQNFPQKIDETKNMVLEKLPNQDTVNGIISQVRGAAEDMSPAGDSADLYKNLLHNYAWPAVCLFAAALVYNTVGGILGTFAGMVLEGSGTGFLVCFLLLPYLIVDYVPTKVEGSDDDKRMYQLVIAVVDMVLFTATLMVDKWVMFSAPPMFLLPLLIGVLSNAAGPALGTQPRHVLLGVIVGVPVGVYFVYGMVMKSLSGMYFVWMMALAAVAFIDVQLKIQSFKGGKAADPGSQGVSLVAFLLAALVMTWMSASGTDEKPPANED